MRVNKWKGEDAIRDCKAVKIVPHLCGVPGNKFAGVIGLQGVEGGSKLGVSNRDIGAGSGVVALDGLVEFYILIKLKGVHH